MSNEQITDPVSQLFEERIAIRRSIRASLKDELAILLKDSTEEKKAQIEVVDGAFRSVLAKGDKIGYVTSAISSGKQLYDVMGARGIDTVDKLENFREDKQAFYEEVIKPNVDTATVLARDLVQDFDGAMISPAIFEAKKLRWTQEEYMALWLPKIDTEVTDLYFKDGSQYSDGGVEEATQAILMRSDLSYRDGITLRREDASPMPIQEFIANVVEASHHISNFTAPTRNAICLQKLRMAHHVSGDEILHEKFPDYDVQDMRSALSDATDFISESPELLKGIHPAFIITSDPLYDILRNVPTCENDLAGLARRDVPEGVAPSFAGHLKNVIEKLFSTSHGKDR